jgi:cytoskeletal protein RodZ
MVNSSVGKKLSQARLGKQLSIEEAARVTRIRPDKLLDLEEDNYSNFPSMSYAKGFLVIYARFLGVDVRDFADSLHSPNPVSSDDYEYLNAASVGPQPPPSRRPYHFSPRREHTILPVIVFGVLAGAIGLAIYLVVSFQRLGNLEDIADKKDLSSPAASASPAITTIPPAPALAPAAPVPTPAPPVAALRATPPAVSTPIPAQAVPLASAAPAIAAASPVTAPAVPVVPPPPTTAAAAQPPLPPPAPAETFDPTREVRRAEPVAPTPPAHADFSPAAALPPVGAGPGLNAIAPATIPDTVKQVSILPIRKTMVTIRKDVADSAPIFEDWLYPGDGPLKVSGHKLWIQVQDPDAVQITQDGQPLPAGKSDIQIE